LLIFNNDNHRFFLLIFKKYTFKGHSMRSIPFLIGLRYTRAKRKNNFLSFISAVSMVGMALGVMVLIIVLSVMNGFEKELRDNILGMIPHAEIDATNTQLDDWRKLQEFALENPDIIAAAPYIQADGLLGANGTKPVRLRGIIPELQNDITDMESKVVSGSISDLLSGEFNIVLGSDLAYSLGVDVGDKVLFASLEGASVGLAGADLPRKYFTVTGIFTIGAQMDSILAIVNMNDLSRVKRMKKGSAMGVQLKTTDLFTADIVVRNIAYDFNEKTGELYSFGTWKNSQGGLFQAIQMEKRMMGLLLIMIMVVAGFNIVSSLIMLVTDKQGDIAILRTMGATPMQIMGIFMVQGTLIGFIGIVIGTVLGIVGALTIPSIVSWFEQVLGFQVLSTDVYFINYLPSDLRLENVIMIVSVSVVISLLATIYPSWRASRILPSEALRYE
jgi:lipoprotein-releasing system permease protein